MTKEEILKYIWEEVDGYDLTWDSHCEKLAEQLLRDGWSRHVEAEWVWKTKIEPQAQNRLYCSACDNECLSKGNYYVKSNWCPHCGAKMI